MPSLTRSCPACATPLPDEAQFCMHCGKATPTDPGVPPRTMETGAFEVSKVRKALANRYRVERVLGEGGMATVYLAEDLKHHRKVAVKVMRPELAATLGADRFLREIEIAAQLAHPSILAVYDSGEVEGVEGVERVEGPVEKVSRPSTLSTPSTLLYYVMPYVEGGTIRDRLARDTQLPVGQAVKLAREMAEALAYAHERGIIHRDIKPANVLLGAGHALVADFGIARALGAEGEALTRTGLAVGTPHYMAPEQSSGDREVDGRADIYAVGSVLYEMLAGEPPFTGPSARAIITRSMTERPRAITATRTEVPAAIEAVVMKALSKGPVDRYQTAQELVDALDEAVEAARTPMPGTVPAAKPVVADATDPRKAWGMFALGSVAAAALIYGAVRQWGLPSWVLVLAGIQLAIGIIAMVLTSRYESIRRRGGTTTGLSDRFTWKNAATGGFLSMGLWTLVAAGIIMRGPASAGEDGVLRLAVLPFENRGAESDAYFVDGVTDEVRSKLTRIPSVQVIARSSSDLYRGTTKTPSQIADELGVDYLLTGTVTWIKSGDGQGRVQVSPELMDVRTGAARWKERFDTRLTDVLSVQSDIAGQVATALGVALGGADREQIGERPTENAAAYDLYLKGRAITDKAPSSLRVAVQHYEQAVAIDDSFAQAWAALSATLSGLFVNGNRDRAIGQRARIAAERALALAPNDPMANLAMADYASFVSLDADLATRHVQRALEVAPNDATVLQRSARADQLQGRPDEAIAKLRKALSIDPRSADAAQAMVYANVRSGRFREALEASPAAVGMDPTNLQLGQFEAMAHASLGNMDGAHASIRRLLGAVPPPAVVAWFAGYYETSWMLEAKERELLFRLTPSAFDGDRAWWAQSLATAHWDAGNRARAREYADSALAPSRTHVEENPGDAQSRILYGLMLAYTGHADSAVAEGARALTQLTGLIDPPYIRFQMARIHLALGQHERALDVIEALLKQPTQYSAAWFRVDPVFAPLRGNERFRRLVERS